MAARMRFIAFGVFALAVSAYFISQSDAGMSGWFGAWASEAAGNPLVNGVLPLLLIGFLGVYAWVALGSQPRPGAFVAMTAIAVVAIGAALVFTDGAAEADGHGGSNLSWMVDNFFDRAAGNDDSGGGR